jgi:hypothetical protein
MRRVRVGSVYVYRPAVWDQIDPPYDLQPGDRVRVVRLPGCPPANTMGHCHVAHLDGRFAGLVQTASLHRE